MGVFMCGSTETLQRLLLVPLNVDKSWIFRASCRSFLRPKHRIDIFAQGDFLQSSDGSVYCASSDETLKVVQYTESESGGELKQNVAMGGVLTQLGNKTQRMH